MKKTAYYIILIAILVGFIACEEIGDPPNDFRFIEIEGGKALEIIDHRGGIPDVHIPPKINGKNVESIAERAFADKRIETIVIPRNVKRIGANAFAGNPLRSIHIGSNVAIDRTSFDDPMFFDFYDDLYGKRAGLYEFDLVRTKEEWLNVYFMAAARWSSFSANNLRRLYNEHDMSKDEFFKMMHMAEDPKREDYSWMTSEKEWRDFLKNHHDEKNRIVALSNAAWEKEKKDLRDEIDRGWSIYREKPEKMWVYKR